MTPFVQKAVKQTIQAVNPLFKEIGYMDSFRGFLRQGKVTSEIGVSLGLGLGLGLGVPVPYPQADADLDCRRRTLSQPYPTAV